jgi:hypothetical protein
MLGPIIQRLGLGAVRLFLRGAGSGLFRQFIRSATRGTVATARIERIMNILDKLMRRTERTTVMSHILRNTHGGDLLELILDLIWAVTSDDPDEAIADDGLRSILRDKAIQALLRYGVIRSDCLDVPTIEKYIRQLNTLIGELDKSILVDETATKISASRAFYNPSFFQGSSPLVQALSQALLHVAVNFGFTDGEKDPDRIMNLVASSTKSLLSREYFGVIFNVAVLLGLTSIVGQLACALATKQTQITPLITLPCLNDISGTTATRDIPLIQNSLSQGIITTISKKYSNNKHDDD